MIHFEFHPIFTDWRYTDGKEYSIMERTWDVLIDHSDMINAIRDRNKAATTVESLREYLKKPRSAADAAIRNLSNAGLIKKSGLEIIPEAGYFLGISIGSRHIRVVLLDLAFRPVPRTQIPKYIEIEALKVIEPDEEPDEDSFTFLLPDEERFYSFDSVKTIVVGVVKIFLELAYTGVGVAPGSQDAFPLMGIGFGVTGPVDYNSALWCSTRFSDISNISLQDLVGYQNLMLAKELGVFLSIDNNSKSSAVSEYQYLFESSQGTYAHDIFLLYIGSGVGSAAVVGHKLLRGSHNASGELGKIKLTLSGEDETVESIENYLMPTRGISRENIEDRYKRCIPQILNLANCVLGVDRFVLVGHSLRSCNKLIPDLMDQRIKFTVESTQKYCSAEPGRGKPSTSAIGAAIEAYFCMCSYQSDAAGDQRINLAKDITWHMA